MKALLLLDGYTLIKQLKLLLLFITVYGGISLFCREYLFLGFCVMFLILIPYYLMQMCDSSRTDAFLLTLPSSRRLIVSERYLTVVLSLLPAAVLVLLTGLVIDWETAMLVVMETGLGILVISVMLPLAFRFGTSKSRLILLFGIAAIFGLISALNIRPLTFLPEGFFPMLTALSIPAALAVLFVSYWICLKLYAKREF